MTAPNDDRFGSSSEEYRRLGDVFKSAEISVSDDTIAKIGNVYQSAGTSVSDDAIAEIGDREEFADLIRRLKEEARRQLEIWLKRASPVNVGKSRRARRQFEIWLKRALKNLSFQESQSPPPLSALRSQPTTSSQLGRFANERQRKPVANSKIRKTELSFKRRPSVRRRTNGR